ncbi:nuclear protein localization protein 4 homolog [Anopheles darlingi]|uniref:nuclear protein localization protein 4 homolog n=1 Tax=Anopheles darlingi TaxID=43151 RepID=UPI00210046B1|nr:nuclear protein localization protein 4 homolog [Anopheles darlingi]XP_049535202.1 nuclear protein localization protein 4 homolog [Anopheles darlingi]
MSGTNKILLRIQSAHGTKRIETELASSTRALYELAKAAFQFDNYEFALFRERNFTKEIVSAGSQYVKDIGLKHGDMIYLREVEGPSTSKATERSASASSLASSHSSSASLAGFNTDAVASTSAKSSSFAAASSTLLPQEDVVDVELYKQDGRIQRKRDEKLCRHNSNGCCVHCSPVEPWDENYLKEQKIKHFSFHSYLKKLTSGADRGKFVALEDLNCKIKTGCRDHPPWPKGICSKCQPSAITLNRQQYRHVDNVMFENTGIVERFLNYWRTTGHQRIGYLYGTYEIHPDVPLGIRARVAAIYEPQQESNRDTIRLLDGADDGDVDEMAKLLGLQRVGWIFTDLLSENLANGTVKHVRNIKTHFLTSQECILAGHLQNKHPNRCKYSSNGYFGSKFVTVCVTGDEKKQVHMEGYAVSAQCMALVRDNCLIPTKDAPELGYIRESTDKQYVPDVYYKEKDVYGNEVQRLGRPLPVEYLLVDVPASTPLVPLYTFLERKDAKEYFPVENRLIDGHIQDFSALASYLAKSRSMDFLDVVSDFHLLLFLYRMEDMLPMKSQLGPLLEAVRIKDKALANEWKTREVWKTLEELIAASSHHDDGSMSNDVEFVPSGDAEQNWICSFCTFINSRELSACEICNLPRSRQ